MPHDSNVSKQRLDDVLVTRRFVPTREQAQRMILAGAVKVDGTRVDKQAKRVATHAVIELEDAPPFVSRGGEKLLAALEAFPVHVPGVVAMDIGASTGGFTDCLLKQGARRVYAVDVGYGQLDWSLRKDERVVVLERCNIRRLAPAAIPEPIHLVAIDVSFISLRLVLPRTVEFLAPKATVIVLVKPQFEVGVKQVGRGGVVRDDALRRETARRIQEMAGRLGFECMGTRDSPIQGKKGNREILLGLRWTAPGLQSFTPRSFMLTRRVQSKGEP